MTDYDPVRVRAEAESHFNGTDGFANHQRKNAYECDDCGAWIVTIDREAGVTPFMVACGICKAMAKSKFYRVSEHLTPTHEWFRPETLDSLSRWEAEHVEKGGLLLRKIGGGDASEGWNIDPPDAGMKRDELIAAMKQKLAAEQREIADAVKISKVRARQPFNKIKREDYPSRQAYRHAVAQARKSHHAS